MAMRRTKLSKGQMSPEDLKAALGGVRSSKVLHFDSVGGLLDSVRPRWIQFAHMLRLYFCLAVCGSGLICDLKVSKNCLLCRYDSVVPLMKQHEGHGGWAKLYQKIQLIPDAWCCSKAGHRMYTV